jgi:glycosyltransferase involved in cell wall biosynthesis
VRAAFVTNLCTHYRRPLFEELARRLEIDFFLTSKGSEWYTLREYRGGEGAFSARRVTGPALVRGLAAGGYDTVLANLAGRVGPLVSYAVARVLRKRFVLWVGIWAHPGGLAHRLSRPLARHLYRHADAVVCYGPHVARFVERESSRTDGVVCTRQAVEDEKFRRRVPAGRLAALRTELGVRAAPLVTFVGRFEPDKGLEYLLRASAAASADHRLLLVGKGSLEPELRALADELGIAGRVRFAGYVGQDDLPAYLQASDVLVLPSVATARFLEPWGLVLNEAMAAGTAVVATTAVGAAAGGLVVDGETGLVVPERNAAALAGAIDRLLGDDAFRTTLARRGSAHVRAWSCEAAADVFEAALTGHPRAAAEAAA